MAQPAVVFCAEFWGGRYRWIFDSAGRLVLCLEATFLETAGCGFRADLVGDIHLGSHLRLAGLARLPGPPAAHQMDVLIGFERLFQYFLESALFSMAPPGLVHDRTLIYMAKYCVSDGIHLSVPPPVSLAALALFDLGHHSWCAELHHHCVERAIQLLNFCLLERQPRVSAKR